MAPFALHRRSNPARRAPGPQARRFALGTRSLADLVAPAALEVARDHVRLEQQYARTLFVTGYPRTVGPGWLAPLIDFELPLEISLHVYPLESGEMVRTLTQKLVQLNSSRLFEARGGRLADPEREVAYEDTERLRDALQRGDERVFSVSLYLLLRASALQALDELTRRVEITLDGMLAHSRVAILEQDAGFRSCLPEGHDALLVYRNLDTRSLATTFPFASSTLAMERGVHYGIAKHNHSPVIFDPFDDSLENANAVIFAKSGAGKSYFTKLMALRNLLVGVDFLIVDPEDEYRSLCTAVGGAGPRPLPDLRGGRHHPGSPHAPPPGAGAERPARHAGGERRSGSDQPRHAAVAVRSWLAGRACRRAHERGPRPAAGRVQRAGARARAAAARQPPHRELRLEHDPPRAAPPPAGDR